jgi:hypothetical protein
MPEECFFAPLTTLVPCARSTTSRNSVALVSSTSSCSSDSPSFATATLLLGASGSPLSSPSSRASPTNLARTLPSQCAWGPRRTIRAEVVVPTIPARNRNPAARCLLQSSAKVRARDGRGPEREAVHRPTSGPRARSFRRTGVILKVNPGPRAAISDGFFTDSFLHPFLRRDAGSSGDRGWHRHRKGNRCSIH